MARITARGTGWATVGEPPHVFTTLGRHRRLFRSWLPFAGTMLLRTHLPRADVELVVLRTAFNCSSPYVWAQHVPLARKAGVSMPAIVAIPHWGDRNSLTARQCLLLAATDELHSCKVISGVSWGELTFGLDERELIELCMLVGHYEMLAMTLNSLGVEPESRALAALEWSPRQTAEHLQVALDAASSCTCK